MYYSPTTQSTTEESRIGVKETPLGECGRVKVDRRAYAMEIVGNDMEDQNERDFLASTIVSETQMTERLDHYIENPENVVGQMQQEA